MTSEVRWTRRRFVATPESDGYTFIEILVVTTILLVLASAVMPLAQVTAQRQREAELKRYLREMRTAIDRFKDAADQGAIAATDIEANSEGWAAQTELVRKYLALSEKE